MLCPSLSLCFFTSCPGDVLPLEALCYGLRLFIVCLKPYLHMPPAWQLSVPIVMFPRSRRSLFQSAVKTSSRHEIKWEFYDLCLMPGNSINFYEVLWANAWRSVQEEAAKGFSGLEASQMPHGILLPGSPCNDAWRQQEKRQELKTNTQTASAWKAGETWAEVSLGCIPAPAQPFGSWNPVYHCGKTSLTQRLSGRAGVPVSHSRAVTVTGYILIPQARRNFLISACAQTHCARICLQSEVPSTVPVAP